MMQLDDACRCRLCRAPACDGHIGGRRRSTAMALAWRVAWCSRHRARRWSTVELDNRFGRCRLSVVGLCVA